MPTKEELLAHLDFEINQVLAARQKDGWTNWALYGVIASCFWFIFDQLERPNLEYRLIFLLILVFTIGTDILRQLLRFLPIDRRRFQRTARFRLFTEAHSVKGGFLHLVRHIFILILVIAFASRVAWSEAAATILYYGYYTLMTLIALPVMYFPNLEGVFPSKNTRSLLRYYIYWAILIAFLFWGFIGYLNAALAFSPPAESIANYRIAALLMVIAYSMFLLIEHKHKLPLLSFLLDMRREVIFNRIDLPTAIRNTEIAVAGATVDETLQDDVLALLPLLEQREKDFERLEQSLAQFSRELPDEPTNEEVEAKVQKFITPCLQS